VCRLDWQHLRGVPRRRHSCPWSVAQNYRVDERDVAGNKLPVAAPPGPGYGSRSTLWQGGGVLNAGLEQGTYIYVLT